MSDTKGRELLQRIRPINLSAGHFDALAPGFRGAVFVSRQLQHVAEMPPAIDPLWILPDIGL